MSYSTVTSSLPDFDGIAGIGYTEYNHGFEKSLYSGTVTKTRFADTNQGYCKDITTFLKECYNSDYDSYWNYNNTWTWTGTVNGSAVNVSCPRLSWE